MTRKPPQLLSVDVVWRCGCGHTQTDDKVNNLEVEGGCGGHGFDEYCYCESQVVKAEVKCLACGKKASLSLT